MYIQIKIYLLSILHISLQIQYNLNLKIREDRNHSHHISSFHKTYPHMRNSYCLPPQLLINLSCVRSRGCVLLSGTFLQTERRVKRKRQCLYPNCCHHLILWTIMMQHCFYNLRYICSWTFVASTKDIWDIECERIRCWINERVTYINNIPCITQYNETERNNFILFKYEIPCLNIFTSR